MSAQDVIAPLVAKLEEVAEALQELDLDDGPCGACDRFDLPPVDLRDLAEIISWRCFGTTPRALSHTQAEDTMTSAREIVEKLGLQVRVTNGGPLVVAP